MRLLLVASAFLTAVAAEAVSPPIPGVVTTVLPGTATDLPIPDAANGSPGTLVDVVLANDVPGVVVDADVTIHLAHDDPSHLDIYLVSPTGTTITLSTDNGQSFDDVFADTTFDDQAPGDPAPNVRNVVYVSATATGPVQPEEALGALVGEPAAGPWALVVNDDTGGTRGDVVNWSLTLYSVPGLAPSAPVTFGGGSGSIPDNNPQGRASTAVVSGLGPRLHDVDVTLDITHPNASDLDVSLTAPSGRRIELVTDVGGGNADLYMDTVFDDQAGEPIADQTLPASGEAFTAVVPEGALAAFHGEDPNGTWTLTVVDDQGGSTGTLEGWSLTLSTATACGDGTLDPGEVCDDGNAADGDGCDNNCTPTACGNGVVSPGEDCDDGNTASGDACPATCRTLETSCADCLDDDGNGLVDSADPACGAGTLELRGGTLAGRARGKLRLTGAVPVAEGMTGGVGVVLGDASGPVLCAALGELRTGRRPRPVKGRVGGGRLTLKLVPSSGGFTLAGRGLGLAALDDPQLVLGLRVGAQHLLGTATLRARGAGRWVFP